MLNGAAIYSAVSDRIPEPFMQAAMMARALSPARSGIFHRWSRRRCRDAGANQGVAWRRHLDAEKGCGQASSHDDHAVAIPEDAATAKCIARAATCPLPCRHHDTALPNSRIAQRLGVSRVCKADEGGGNIAADDASRWP